jgi:hypothetical protein
MRLLLSLGIGEALVTALNEKGIPTPLAATMLRVPKAGWIFLLTAEISAINSSSDLVRKYSQVIDRESAYEILGRKASGITKGSSDETSGRESEMQQNQPRSRTTYGRSGKTPQDEIVKVLTSATFIRGVFGILKKVMK